MIQSIRLLRTRYFPSKSNKQNKVGYILICFDILIKTLMYPLPLVYFFEITLLMHIARRDNHLSNLCLSSVLCMGWNSWRYFQKLFRKSVRTERSRYKEGYTTLDQSRSWPDFGKISLFFPDQVNLQFWYIVPNCKP